MSSESSDIADINFTFIHYAFNTCYNIDLNYYRRKYKKLLYISRHTTILKLTVLLSPKILIS